MEDKYCLYCGELLVRRDGERLKAYIERKHCNTTCANRREHRSKRGKPSFKKILITSSDKTKIFYH